MNPNHTGEECPRCHWTDGRVFKLASLPEWETLVCPKCSYQWMKRIKIQGENEKT